MRLQRARRGAAWLLAIACSGSAAGAGTGCAGEVEPGQVLNPDLGAVAAFGDAPLLAWGSDATVWWHDAAAGRWLPAPTPHRTRIHAVAASGSARIAVGSDGLLLHSADQGRSWTAVVHDAPRPVDWTDADCRGATCIAVGDQGALLRSDDGGLRWAAPKAAPAGAWAAVRSADGGRWWMAGPDGRLWHSADDGRHWHERPGVAKRGGAIDALAIDDDGSVLAARRDGSLQSVPAEGGPPRTLLRSPRGGFTRITPLAPAGTWIATGAQGACALRHAGSVRWQRCDTPARKLLRAAAASPDGRHWVVVGEDGLLLQRESHGERWQPAARPADLDTRLIEGVAWSTAHGGFVAVGTGGLVLRSDAEGRRWHVERTGPEHYVHAVVRTGPGQLLAALSHRSLARSDDGGGSWRTHRFTGLVEPAYLFTLHLDPATGALVAGGGQGSVLAAPDGRHWRHESLGHGRDYEAMLAWPGGDGMLLLYGSGGVLQRVDSRQGRWHAVTLPAREPLHGGFAAGPDAVWLVGANGRLLEGREQGLVWRAYRFGSAALFDGMAWDDGRVLLAAGDRGTLWRGAADARGGRLWRQVDTPPADWRWLQADAAGRAIWLGGVRGALARSLDGGLSWAAVDLPTQASMRRPVHDAARGRWWMPGRDGALLCSDDDGERWQAVDSHTREHLKGAWVDPDDGSLLLYGARLVRLPMRSAARAAGAP